MLKILVAYATKHNSTAEIANIIGDTLQQARTRNSIMKVKVMPVETVRGVTEYDAVVLGSAVYAGQWQAGAADFLKKHEMELAERPVWLFSSGPTGEGDPQTLLKGWKFPQALMQVAERIKPRDIAVFHGNLDPAKLSLFERVVIKGVNAPTGDFRDSEMIRTWANNIAQSL
jgi:menaquinone-dependent protoporphyrinogen oxidase